MPGLGRIHGGGSGGARVGAGRPKKGLARKRLEGTATRVERRYIRKALPLVGPVAEPNDLRESERLIWRQLAPHALEKRTLTPATAYSFALLCRNIVLEREFRAKEQFCGGSSHRAMIQRVDAELIRFCLSPMGKPLVEEEAPVDEWAEFDGTPN